jgi:hypothetical protein
VGEGRGSSSGERPHVSDDETVANMGHPMWPVLRRLFVFFFEDEVGGLYEDSGVWNGLGEQEGDWWM